MAQTTFDFLAHFMSMTYFALTLALSKGVWVNVRLIFVVFMSEIIFNFLCGEEHEPDESVRLDYIISVRGNMSCVSAIGKVCLLNEQSCDRVVLMVLLLFK